MAKPLAADLQCVWSALTTDARLKKRIVRTVIHGAIADLDEARAEIVPTVDWVGGEPKPSTVCRVDDLANAPERTPT